MAGRRNETLSLKLMSWLQDVAPSTELLSTEDAHNFGRERLVKDPHTPFSVAL